MIKAGKKTDLTLSLKFMPCIHDLVQFKNDQAKNQALFDFDNEVNTMTLAYAAYWVSKFDQLLSELRKLIVSFSRYLG